MRMTEQSTGDIPKYSRVEHAHTGQQGTVVAHSRAPHSATRHHIRWDALDYDTPGGVVAERLIIIKRANPQ